MLAKFTRSNGQEIELSPELEAEIERLLTRSQAIESMKRTFAAFDSLPDEDKPSEEEILAIVREVRGKPPKATL